MIGNKIGEHYYTTSKFKNGLHTIDRTLFLTTEEVSTLEKFGTYQPPVLFDANSTDEGIRSDFPVNFAFYKLPAPSNRFVYLHSKYTGRANHTPDRFGNFFSHSIVLKEVEPTLPAILFFDQVKFKDSFPPEEDTSFVPGLTERVIELDDRALRPFFSELCEFLQHENNISVFSKVYDLLVDGSLLTRGNNITISGDKDRIRKLILSFNFFLPQHLANKISFATYVNSPKGYPFQIIGVIPECRITSLDSRYYTLIDNIENLEYAARHMYTRHIVSIVRENSDRSFENWMNLNEDLKTEFIVNETNTRLNLPALFSNFIADPPNKTLQELKALFNADLPQKKIAELKSVCASANPRMYLEYILDDFRGRVTANSLMMDKKQAFGQLYRIHFNDNDTFRTVYLPYLVDEFKRVSSEERSEASLDVLSVANCTHVSPESWLDDLFSDADKYFTDISESNISIVNQLGEKYNLSEIHRIPNIIKTKTFDAVRKSASKSYFLKEIDSHASFINSLTSIQKTEILLIAFNNDEGFYEGIFKEIERHVSLIRKYLADYQPQFWLEFLSNPALAKIPGFSKVERVKKKFVVELFLNPENNYRLFINIFNRLDINDEYSVRWMAEEIESSGRRGLLSAFYQIFGQPSSSRGSSPWYSFKS